MPQANSPTAKDTVDYIVNVMERGQAGTLAKVATLSEQTEDQVRLALYYNAFNVSQGVKKTGDIQE